MNNLEFTLNLLESVRSLATDRKLARIFRISPVSIQYHLGRRPGFNHGMVGTSEYNSWRGMVQRCTNPNSEIYAYYGGRGIKVCERWFDFRNFLADMGRKQDPTLTIERIDNARGYEPGNCRWATRKEQCITRGGKFRTQKGGK